MANAVSTGRFDRRAQIEFFLVCGDDDDDGGGEFECD